MNSFNIKQFLELEAQVWEALIAGDAKADAALLTEHFLGVYSDGFAGRTEHASQLSNGPTVAHHEISDAKLQILADDVVLLAYYAQYTPIKNGKVAAPEAMFVSSIWQRFDDIWKNVFSQDTPEIAPK